MKGTKYQCTPAGMGLLGTALKLGLGVRWTHITQLGTAGNGY